MAEYRAYIRFGSVALSVISATIGVVVGLAFGGFKPRSLTPNYGVQYDPSVASQLEPWGSLLFVLAPMFISVCYYWPVSGTSTTLTECGIESRVKK